MSLLCVGGCEWNLESQLYLSVVHASELFLIVRILLFSLPCSGEQKKQTHRRSPSLSPSLSFFTHFFFPCLVYLSSCPHLVSFSFHSSPFSLPENTRSAHGYKIQKSTTAHISTHPTHPILDSLSLSLSSFPRSFFVPSPPLQKYQQNEAELWDIIRIVASARSYNNRASRRCDQVRLFCPSLPSFPSEIPPFVHFSLHKHSTYLFFTFLFGPSPVSLD